MTFERDEIEKIVNKVVGELLAQPVQTREKRTLAIFAGYVFAPERVIPYLRERRADAVAPESSLPESGGIKTIRIRTEEEKSALVSVLADYDEVALVTPPLSLIKTLAQADDSVFEAMLVLRALLWGRKVTLILDFSVPKFRRNTMLAELADALDALEKTGVEIMTLEMERGGGDDYLDLVTEQHIKDAYKNKGSCVRIKEGAIVTQLARDTAKELGVAIER